MLRLRSFCIFSILVNLVIAATAKIPPSFPLWKEQARNAVYSRSLGSSAVSGMDTMSIPYVPKPLFFPKFVDPKVMIAQKTELLKNLFGSSGLVHYPITNPSDDSFNFDQSKPSLYATNNEIEPSEDTAKLETILGSERKELNYAKRSVFEPKFGSLEFMKSKFSPLSSKFTSGSSYSYPETEFNNVDLSEPLSQRKRSIISPITNVPTNQGPFPLYPEVGSMFEYPQFYNYSAPQNYIPSVFGPFGPYSGYNPFDSSPVIDPASIFAAKKTAFLNELFKSLSTSGSNFETDTPISKSTSVPVNFWSSFKNTEITTEIPVPKSTIVPPGFWAPSSIIPAPGEYTSKVSIFLDKLFKSIANKTATKAASAAGATINDNSPGVVARSFLNDLPYNSVDRVARSVDDIPSLSIAKDAIGDSIIAELRSLKTDMLNNFNDLITAQQLSMTSMGKSSIKSSKTGLYKSMSTDYSIPYKQKMMVLCKVFDLLTELQKNISSAVSDAIQTNINEDSDQGDQYSDNQYSEPKYMFNETFADTFQDKINPPMTYQDPALFYQPFSSSYQQKFPFYQPPVPVQPTEPFWMAYVKSKSSTLKPKKVKGIKREIESDSENYDLSKDYNKRENKRDQYKRAVKMFMRQGLPLGTVENTQAGGGSESGHQGGRMKLLNLHNYEDNYPDWNERSDWADNFYNPYKIHKNKHHH